MSSYGQYKAFFAAEWLPLYDKERLSELVEDIRKHGQLEPCHVWGNFLVDGRNRWRACEMIGLEPRIEVHDFADETAAVDFVASRNVVRRDLTTSQRALFAARRREHYQKHADQRMLAGQADPSRNFGQGRWVDEAGREHGVSGDSVRHGVDVETHGSENLKSAVAAGELAVSAAAMVAKVTNREEQDELLANYGPEGIRSRAAVLRAMVKAEKSGSFGQWIQHPMLAGFHLDAEVIDEIARSISTLRQLEPIVVWNGQIIDGRLRWLACAHAGVEPKIVHGDFKNDEDAVSYIFSMNLFRKSFTKEKIKQVKEMAKAHGF